MTATFIVGDTREVTASLADGSVDLLLSSPPFLSLRSYLPMDHPNKALEIGSEPDPATFIDVLLELTAEWRRVLAPHGSLCLELGDTYSGSGGAGGDYADEGWREGQPTFKQSKGGWPLPKCLALVPELYRIGLAYGINPLTGAPSPAGRWRVRNVVRWVRPNPPVGALGDKFRPATSDLVVACVATDRYFDLDATRTELKYDYTPYPSGAPPLDWWHIVPSGYSGAHYAVWPPALCERPIEAMCPRRVCVTCGKPSRRITSVDYTSLQLGAGDNAENKASADYAGQQRTQNAQGMANGRADKNVTTTGWSSCGCPNSDGLQLDGYHTGNGWRPGLVFDPFCGTFTTGVVAHGHSRDSIGADLDPRNAELAAERLGMFLTIQTQQKEETHGITQ